MTEAHDIELLINSRIPIIVIESHEELRVLDLLQSIAFRNAKPLFKWSITTGLKRIDIDMPAQKHNAEPAEVLKHINVIDTPGIYVLTDFHPFLDEPLHVRLLKDIAIEHDRRGHTLVLLSHEIKIPGELVKLSAVANLALPTKDELDEIVRTIAREWAQRNGEQVKTDRKTLDMLISNLSGLTYRDAKTLARKAVYDDGAVTQSDLPEVMQAKYELLSRDGILSFEYDTARFADVGGFSRLKQWLDHRRTVFHSQDEVAHLDKPKGVMLLGVQGCGKSLAAKSIAGSWGVPLLRLDFGTLYNKFYGETERNLRESLKTAEAMSPCVLWIDEIEKGVSSDNSDGGTSRRVLGTLLTWMAEKNSSVFIVSTANDISALPPELVRKGRFDEIFFVDLPKDDIRKSIFDIHISSRDIAIENFNLEQLVSASQGFSGAEIEQAVVSAQYAAHAQNQPVTHESLLTEISQTRPLSVVMAEKIAELRAWAKDRTVPCD